MKTTVLLAALGGLIVAVAGLLGGGSSGAVMIGLVLALVMVGGSYWFSDKLALRAANAQVITESDHPEFYGMVRDLARRAELPMPTVALSPSDQPNAFATGRGPQKAVVCATTGLLQSLSRDEIEGVMAHELMHVKNRDILIGSVAAAIATAISSIAQMAMFATMFAGSSDDEDRPNPFAVILVSMLAPLAASLRQRRGRVVAQWRITCPCLGTHRSDGTTSPHGGGSRSGPGVHPQPTGRDARARLGAKRRSLVLHPPEHSGPHRSLTRHAIQLIPLMLSGRAERLHVVAIGMVGEHERHYPTLDADDDRRWLLGCWEDHVCECTAREQ
jgi:hypothetical protein